MFDQVLAVDWSSAKQPKVGKDSCWLALASDGDVERSNPSTRRRAIGEVEAAIDDALVGGQRILVGFDASFGFARGLHDALGLRGEDAWLDVWKLVASLVTDGPRNDNNRFLAANQLNEQLGAPWFWGRPQGGGWDGLTCLPSNTAGRGEHPPPLRYCEQLAPGAQSSWKLYGIGSVGGQVLTLMPYLLRLHERYEGKVHVWPFDGWDPGAARVVLAELWFSHRAFRADVDEAQRILGGPRDEAQVVTTARRLQGYDQDHWDSLLRPAAIFGDGSLGDLGEVAGKVAQGEEGWTLEVGGFA